MTVELNAEAAVGEPVNLRRVARLMRANGIVGVHLRKPKTTTATDPGAQVFADLINRDFTAGAPGEVYDGDLTYLAYGGKGELLYLATVIDVSSKRLVGWSIAEHMRTGLVEEALHHATAARGTLKGAIFGSDHRRQYTYTNFPPTCRDLGVTQSMGRIVQRLAEARDASRG